MKSQDIQPGMHLLLKPERQRDYGLESPVVLVHSLKPRKGYVVPWVIVNEPWTDCTGEKHAYKAFNPSDFLRCA